MNGHYCQIRWAWCVCGCAMHIDGECRCTCTIAELDNGTDGPRRGNTSGGGAFKYVGRYSGPYINTLGVAEKITYGGGG